MKNINIRSIFKNGATEKVIIILASIVLIYMLISLYFTKHFFFHTVINGVDVSLKSYQKADEIIISYTNAYELKLVERNNESEVITGKDIDLNYNERNSISNIYKLQNSFVWCSSLFKDQKYYVNDLFIFNHDKLKDKINGLQCLNQERIDPKNVSFQYINGIYEVIDEVYGNIVLKDKLSDAIEQYILSGKTDFVLEEKHCYLNPKYTRNSEKTAITKKLLNQYVSSKIYYVFADKREILDGDTTNGWLSVDEDLEVVINKSAVRKYVKALSKKYDTVGIARDFKTSTGKSIVIMGGIYGWKINQEEETKALIKNIMSGTVIEKEPIYTQKAISRAVNDIGNTYVEINISRQHLWYYKDGKLITQGPIVTGNPNRGNATVLGIYMINYKQKNTVLKGLNYEAKVTYWMPFYGNIGLHDATWRSSFGGVIYKRRGTHGCVNLPYSLAKIIFMNIEAGVPIICYEE